MAGGLTEVGGDLEEALERVNVPSYVLDPNGVVRWLNQAAVAVVGDVRGKQFTSLVADDDTRRSRELFARKVAGKAPATDAEVTIVAPSGERFECEVCSVPLRDDHSVVGNRKSVV